MIPSLRLCVTIAGIDLMPLSSVGSCFPSLMVRSDVRQVFIVGREKNELERKERGGKNLGERGCF